MNKSRIISVTRALVLPLILPVALNAQTMTIVIDGTGSMANQAGVNLKVAEAVAIEAAPWGRIQLVVFSDHVRDIPATAVAWKVNDGWQSQIGPVSLYQREQLIERAKDAIVGALASMPFQIAKATNLPAALDRAGSESPAGMLVTDGKNEVSYPLKVVTSSKFPVVLCAANGDSGAEELQIAERRERNIKRWAPNVEIFRCTQLKDAVRRLVMLSNQSKNSLRAVGLR